MSSIINIGVNRLQGCP